MINSMISLSCNRFHAQLKWREKESGIETSKNRLQLINDEYDNTDFQLRHIHFTWVTLSPN